VRGSERVPADVRLAVYGGAYRSRLAEALATTYGALAKLLDEDFAALAHGYVRTHDSSYFSIRNYGEQFAEFLAGDPATAKAPLLADLARFEWAMSGAFDAADEAPLVAQDLGAVAPDDWAQLRFIFHPSVARLSLHWNAPQIWQALTDDHERPPAQYQATATEWLLWRQGLATYFRSLDATEARVLDAARAGWPFGELCELLCACVGDDEAAGEAAMLLRGWVEAGLLTGTSAG
jgi:hypothetical protein